jgi:methyl coenzyme M reductase gamma subunit
MCYATTLSGVHGACVEGEWVRLREGGEMHSNTFRQKIKPHYFYSED